MYEFIASHKVLLFFPGKASETAENMTQPNSVKPINAFIYTNWFLK